MAIEISRRLLVDRISIVVSVPSQELYSFVFGQLEDLPAMSEELAPKAKIILRKYKYQSRLDFYPEYSFKMAGRRKLADITIGATKTQANGGSHRYFKLTLYPQQMQGEEFENFKWLIAKLLPDFEYKNLFSTGRVSYLELAIDSGTRKHHSFLPYRKKIKKSSIFVKDGVFGTTYLGSTTSASRFRIYDKQKQLLETGKAPFFKVFNQTRIESIQRNLGMSPAQLGEMENPFEKLFIVDLMTARSAYDDSEWQDFLDDCLVVGVPSALSTLKASPRKIFRGRLGDLQAEWWKPSEHWKHLDFALKCLDP